MEWHVLQFLNLFGNLLCNLLLLWRFVEDCRAVF